MEDGEGSIWLNWVEMEDGRWEMEATALNPLGKKREKRWRQIKRLWGRS